MIQSITWSVMAVLPPHPRTLWPIGGTPFLYWSSLKAHPPHLSPHRGHSKKKQKGKVHPQDGLSAIQHKSTLRTVFRGTPEQPGPMQTFKDFGSWHWPACELLMHQMQCRLRLQTKKKKELWTLWVLTSLLWRLETQSNNSGYDNIRLCYTEKTSEFFFYM